MNYTDERIYLKVKIKSLAEEARLIRREENRVDTKTPQGVYLCNGLNAHRTYNVRNASRSAHLAYGFLRGRRYREIERTTKPHNAPDWKAVARLVERYGDIGYNSTARKERMERFDEWKQEPEQVALAA